MPRLTTSIPKYRKHRASGQAVVTIDGKDFYLGPHGTKASKAEYDRIINEWCANGRRLPSESSDIRDTITIAELIVRYWKYARGHYGDEHVPGGNAYRLKPVLRVLRVAYGNERVAEFGPLKLKATRQQFIDRGNSRSYVNENINRIKQMFKWGVAEELVHPDVSAAVHAMGNLRKGRCEALEGRDVQPVDLETVNKTIDHLQSVVGDMVQLQMLVACRPSEVCRIRPCDIDRSEDVWWYVPEHHKNKHRGKDRRIAIGPRAQRVLSPYLLRESTAFCFSPVESERNRRAEVHERRKTPINHGNRPGSSNTRKTNRKVGDQYTAQTYRRAVQRAAERAGVEKWSPNQLRHSAGTLVREKYGLEAAQVLLGHSNANVTQIYAERDMTLAARVAREVG